MLPAVYDVTGKVVFITGAGRGIGKGIAQGLAAAGADAVLNALTPRYVENTAAEIAKDTGRRVMPLLADVTNRSLQKEPCACLADCFLPLQLLIFERHKIASGDLPYPIRLLLHGIESHDGDPVRPYKQHSLCRLACQGVEVTKHDLAWTIDRLVPGLDHSHKTFWGLELRLNLRAGQSKSADCIVLT